MKYLILILITVINFSFSSENLECGRPFFKKSLDSDQLTLSIKIKTMGYRTGTSRPVKFQEFSNHERSIYEIYEKQMYSDKARNENDQRLAQIVKKRKNESRAISEFY